MDNETGQKRRRVVAASMGLCAGVVLGATAVDARPLPDNPRPLTLDRSTTAVSTALGSHASVSGDGRFVVHQGAPGAGDESLDAPDTRDTTVYLTDRFTGTTEELTAVPPGGRPGNSIHPVIAGDGCSVVVTTELALDVFRDNDSGLRWDVYRQRLAHCDASGGNWELVSTNDATDGLARDDVSIEDPAAVSRAGTTIVYTHPSDGFLLPDELTSLSIVDLTLPLGNSERTRLVAGTPITSPDTEFVHRGLDQPAISGDGRFVAYRSDAASNEAVPGWGFGPSAGGPAAPQVFVWDRAELDPFEAVRLVSERSDRLPTRTGASQPSLSRDGRMVAFTSDDAGLVPAVFPQCADSCPTQVFHLDRDPDGNGRFDEPGRTSMSLVSHRSGSDPLLAGSAPSSQPSLSADGQLVAFVTKASDLQPVQTTVGGEASDGDLLIADIGLGTLRRVATIGDSNVPAVGAHARPQLSDTGRTVVFDTLSAGQLLPGSAAGRQLVAVETRPSVSLADADLGTTLVGLTSDQWYVAMINDGPTTFVPSRVAVSDPRFEVDQEASTCVLASPVPPGGDCTVLLRFTPDAPGPVEATLTISEEGFQAVEVSADLRGAGGDPALRTNPAGSDFGSVVIGESSYEFLFDVENISLLPISVRSVAVAGANASDFAIASNSCTEQGVIPRATCTVGVVFTPTDSGQRSALVEITTDDDQYTVVVVAGQGRYEPTFVTQGEPVEAGQPFGIAGNGFPPSTSVSVVFADDARTPFVFTTNEDGAFILPVPTSPDERGGQRTVVARAADGTTVSSLLEIIERPQAVAGMPGFGLG